MEQFQGGKHIPIREISLGMESSVDGCEWKQSPETVTKHLYLWMQRRWRYPSILRNRAFQRAGNYKME
jgi:hypothetical protein